MNRKRLEWYIRMADNLSNVPDLHREKYALIIKEIEDSHNISGINDAMKILNKECKKEMSSTSLDGIDNSGLFQGISGKRWKTLEENLNENLQLDIRKKDNFRRIVRWEKVASHFNIKVDSESPFPFISKGFEKNGDLPDNVKSGVCLFSVYPDEFLVRETNERIHIKPYKSDYNIVGEIIPPCRPLISDVLMLARTFHIIPEIIPNFMSITVAIPETLYAKEIKEIYFPNLDKKYVSEITKEVSLRYIRLIKVISEEMDAGEIKIEDIPYGKPIYKTPLGRPRYPHIAGKIYSSLLKYHEEAEFVIEDAHEIWTNLETLLKNPKHKFLLLPSCPTADLSSRWEYSSPSNKKIFIHKKKTKNIIKQSGWYEKAFERINVSLSDILDNYNSDFL